MAPISRLPDDKILALFRLEPFADDKLDVTKNIEFVIHWVENIAGKAENVD